ncbi:MAG: molybdenum cofactor guanylyltransferase [Chloroflexi bacterium]|nr:molybdenum cofactor guanylyltransferase [Chloroflexota bacterium]MCL5074531.1 molybdenum cofactor guanylyltransferase [Chloroflexota bacterium]
MRAPLTVIVLAGGKSSRLGVDKALLTLGRDRPLLQHVIERLRGIGDEVIIVSNSADHRQPGTILVEDIYQEMGSLGGIYSGLLSASFQHALVVACDMPFLNQGLLRYMAELPRDYDVLIPRVEDNLEPLHAIYAKSCLEPIHDLLREGNLKIIDFFPEVRVRYLEETEIDPYDPEHLSFFNINTAAQLRQAEEIIRARMS